MSVPDLVAGRVRTQPRHGRVRPLYALELLVAFLQAYIFTLLSAVFIGLCAHPEH